MNAIKEQIRKAFADTPAPQGKLTDMYDDEGVSEYLKGTHWDGHPMAKLRFHSCTLSFFEPDALRYYLPAFMLAELDDPMEADFIPRTHEQQSRYAHAWLHSK